MPLAALVIPGAAFLWLLGVGVISFAQRGRRAALREQILKAGTPLEIPWEFSTVSKDVVAAAAQADAATDAANLERKAGAAVAAREAGRLAAAKEAGPAAAGASLPSNAF